MIPCKRCGEPTPMKNTKLCNPCWEVLRNVGYLTIDDLPDTLVTEIKAQTLEEIAVKKHPSGHAMFPHVWRERLLKEAKLLKGEQCKGSE